MVIYRLEKDGWGVWSGGLTGVTWTDDALYREYGCTVVEAYQKEQYRFGCQSINKLIEYFGSDFSRLLDNGVEVVEYNIHKAHILFSIEGIELAFKVDKVKYRTVILKGKQCR